MFDEKGRIEKRLVPLDPVKENMGRGTGMGTLMPTWPTSISCVNFLAAAPELVKRAVPD